MSDDLVKRLRTENALAGYYGPPAIHVEAADRIEALEADNQKLRMELLALLGQKIDAPPEGKPHD